MDTWCVSNEKKWRKDTISKDESTWVPGELGPLLRSLLWGNLVILTGMPCGSMVYLIALGASYVILLPPLRRTCGVRALL